MRPIFVILAFPFIYFLGDLLVRFDLLQLYSASQLTYYGLSVVTSTAFFFSAVLVLNKIKDRKFIYHLILFFFSAYLVFTILGSYIFFYFNGFFPNYYTFEYFKNEPLSAFVLLKDSIDFQDIIMFIIGFSLFFWMMKKITQKEFQFNSGKLITIGIILYLSLFVLLTVKIKKYDQCLLVDSNFSAAINRHLFDWEKERKFKGKGLGARTPIYLSKTNEKRDFNVLVVLFESMRKQDLQVYGYQRETTPNLKEFADQYNDEFYLFKHPYAASTTTMLAVPGVLTGIAPYQSPEIFYSQPMLWEYGTILNYHTFFLSSHTFKWYRFDRFYAKERLDHVWNKELSGKEFFNDLGIDDKYTVRHLNALVSEKSERPFFGVVQLNATHYPYNIPKEFKKWKGTFLDEYDNSMYYQDHLIGKLFQELKRSGKLKNTVIIFTSDHGESLKDHNNIGHVDSYYAETISVPLMIYLPDGINKKLNRKVLRQNSAKTVSNIDIAPTLIDILGLRQNESVKKVYGNYTGQSLFDLVPKDRSIIIMNNNEVARFKVGISLIKDNYHYIHRMNIVPNRQELYDIKKDKTEKHNLIEVITKKDLKDLMDTFKEFPACDPYLPEKK